MISSFDTEVVEQQFLACCISMSKSDQRVREAIDVVDVSMFANGFNRDIFNFIVSDETGDFTNVKSHFNKVNPVIGKYLWSLIRGDLAYSISSMSKYSEALQQAGQHRKLVSIAQGMVNAAQDGIKPDQFLEDVTHQINQIAQTSNYQAKHIRELAKDHIKVLEQRAEGKESAIGIKTGLKALDDQIIGLGSNWLVVLSGRPSNGKTLIAQLISESVARRKEVLFFSLEMSESEIVDRAFGLNTSCTPQDIRSGRLTEVQYAELTSLMSDMNDDKIKLYVDTTPALKIQQISSRVKQFKRQNPNTGLIMIDYLGLMGKDSAERNDIALAAITSRLKQLAKEVNIPILLLVQSNRAADKQARMNMSNLADSAAIERDADLVMFVHREEIQNPETERKGIIELSCGKFRHGTFDHDVWIKKFHGSFSTMKPDEIQRIRDIEAPKKKGGGF